ncbi:MAG: hypothetical protein LCH52_02370 [Bacteroidetes bacterium]|nr:hypothetical protein [Bacteroidota bacterium]
MIREKRDELCKFIREQTMGPGAMGYRIINRLKHNENSRIIDDSPLNNFYEILDLPPASIYSTGILFPPAAPQEIFNSLSVPKTTEQDEDTVNGESVGEEQEDNPGNDEPVEEFYEITEASQLYPISMGLTFSVKSDVSWNDVEIKVEARRYRKISSLSVKDTNPFYLLVECPIEYMSKLVGEVNEGYQSDNQILLVEFGKNYLIQVPKDKGETHKNMWKKLEELESRRASHLIPALNNLGLGLPEKAQLSTIYKKCFYLISSEHQNSADFIKIAQEIELFENASAHIKDALKLASFSGGKGIWECDRILVERKFSDLVNPNEIKFRDGERSKNFTFGKNAKLNLYSEELRDGEKSSISMNIRITRSHIHNEHSYYVKLQLVNSSTPFQGGPENESYYSVVQDDVNSRSFFGTILYVSSSSILPVNNNGYEEIGDDAEELREQILYREFKEYGTGHGCSVAWYKSQEGKMTVHTEYLPSYDVPDVDTTPRNKLEVTIEGEARKPKKFEFDTNSLRFKWLSTFSETTNQQIRESLRSFVDAYLSWIDKTRGRANAEDSLSPVLSNLDLCRADYNRMSRNLDYFLGDDNRMNSFRLMNSAMFMQLWHSASVKNDKVKPLLTEEFENFDSNFYSNQSELIFGNSMVSWRPFQLAFILLNLDGIFETEEYCTRNDFVDLVWFPTGGGKTEAYLGLIALSIINRRKTFGIRGGGTAVLMRYTLRLLTLQQFQRATTLIMALELLRRWEPGILGVEPVTIGLWLGKESLPNKRIGDKSLAVEMQKLRDNKPSKIPLEQCLWCGSGLAGETQLPGDVGNNFLEHKLLLKCSNSFCSFNFDIPDHADQYFQGPIPVTLCDEDIYENPPTLLFGTVDKFAQLAHKASSERTSRGDDSRRLFGRGNWENWRPMDGYIPPELIIQDELHLLLGPLGTAVALFETVIDKLCEREDGKRPKIISSTATTRNTELQIVALYNRRLNIFPKPGIDIDDSFFAFYKRNFNTADLSTHEYESKRRYLGVLPTGRTQIWSQMRILAILLTHRAVTLMKHYPVSGEETSADFNKVMDNFHTVIAYFNSLKDLGKTDAQTSSYLIKEVRKVFHRVVRPNKLLQGLYTFALDPTEMTGRIEGYKVKNNLEKLKKPWTQLTEAGYSKVTDIVLATNMISVGIDVPRLNTMLVNSMPRNLSEYIQASSRVARENPGLVVTLHNPFRARDISHFERFSGFHSKIYSFVEPISITPFTPKALEKYFPLYFATMLRHLESNFTDRNNASNISSLNDLQERVDFVSRFLEEFKRRYRFVTDNANGFQDSIRSLLNEGVLEQIENLINQMLDDWANKANSVQDSQRFVFNSPSRNQTALYVDIDEYEDNVHSQIWKVNQSLRIIEQQAAIKIELR